MEAFVQLSRGMRKPREAPSGGAGRAVGPLGGDPSLPGPAPRLGCRSAPTTGGSGSRRSLCSASPRVAPRGRHGGGGILPCRQRGWGRGPGLPTAVRCAREQGAGGALCPRRSCPGTHGLVRPRGDGEVSWEDFDSSPTAVVCLPAGWWGEAGRGGRGTGASRSGDTRYWLGIETGESGAASAC